VDAPEGRLLSRRAVRDPGPRRRSLRHLLRAGSRRTGEERPRRVPRLALDPSMCGIVGILKLRPGEGVEPKRLERMRDTLRHRGPDGEGLLVEGPIGLGHRRLAIVDPKGGRQPMANEDQSVWIICNGEIYNHPDLRPRLEARGHRYRTHSDNETILHLYEEQEDRCVESLRGMFAFALWDRTRGRLLLARDRLGIKPLYYALTEHELIFASEIKAILAAGPIKPLLDAEILPEFLATRFIAGEETFFRGVRKLL